MRQCYWKEICWGQIPASDSKWCHLGKAKHLQTLTWLISVSCANSDCYNYTWQTRQDHFQAQNYSVYATDATSSVYGHQEVFYMAHRPAHVPILQLYGYFTTWNKIVCVRCWILKAVSTWGKVSLFEWPVSISSFSDTHNLFLHTHKAILLLPGCAKISCQQQREDAWMFGQLFQPMHGLVMILQVSSRAKPTKLSERYLGDVPVGKEPTRKASVISTGLLRLVERGLVLSHSWRPSFSSVPDAVILHRESSTFFSLEYL